MPETPLCRGRIKYESVIVLSTKVSLFSYGQRIEYSVHLFSYQAITVIFPTFFVSVYRYVLPIPLFVSTELNDLCSALLAKHKPFSASRSMGVLRVITIDPDHAEVSIRKVIRGPRHLSC